MWRKVKNPFQVKIANNSTMSYNEAIKGLFIEIGRVICIISILWDTDQPPHDMIIGKKFQMLYSSGT